MSASITTIAPKISRLVRLMATEIDGEALGAVRALNRTLVGAGHDMHWLADRIEAGLELPAQPRRSGTAEPDQVTLWDNMLTAARLEWLSVGSRSWVCTDWEREFCVSLRQHVRHFPNRPASDKQRIVASRIFAKLWNAGERP